DLVQQGNLGLLRAAQKFEPEKQCRLITYAVYWIRAEIREYVVRGYRIVRLGSTRTERRAMRAFRRKGIDSPAQLAEESGMPLTRAEKLWPLMVQGDSSLDAQFDDGRPAAARVRDDGSRPDDVVANRQHLMGVRATLYQAVKNLTDRERQIVFERLMSDEPRTLEQLGKDMGVSKERVRQLEERLRNRLRVQFAAFAPSAS
ncbi:MAG: sigma-70 family RNA polymerase sigma factor, partial [Pseudomonadota bacterium]